ncbi:MAG: hypothetical protein A2Y38_07780 [Spirochaetes bacterium GWB1_59_5]|nr:MAG: hypothetical protein A2Y38_07780 [Spirochaetes bacterium GWB1_59_5]
MDARIVYKNLGAGSRFDLHLAAGDLVGEQGLRTAVILSLFLDRRAEPDDEIPDGTGDLRGWWGDAYAETPGDRIGSRLWLLAREKQLPQVVRRAEEYAREALQWLLDDGIATAVEVEGGIAASGTLALRVRIVAPAGTLLDFTVELPESGPAIVA